MEQQRVTVFGAGLMGGEIARVLADAGHEVVIYDPRVDAAGSVAESRPLITAADTVADAVAGSSLLIETIVEKLDVKHGLFAEIEKHDGDTPIASNTSGFSPEDLAEGLQDPTRLVLAHFFNPAGTVPLVEVVPSERTRPEIVTMVSELLSDAGKLVVPLNRAVPGLIANRLQAALYREAMALVRDGVATPGMVDDVVTGSIGPRWAVNGPFRTMDLGGLDTWNAVCATLFPELDTSTEVPDMLMSRLNDNRLGAKTGGGFHDYSPEDLDRRREALIRSFDASTTIAGELP